MQCSESLWKTSKAKLGKIFPDLGGKNFERDFVDIDLHASWRSRLRCFYRSGLPYTWGNEKSSGMMGVVAIP